jgi:hypothetical protein
MSVIYGSLDSDNNPVIGSPTTIASWFANAFGGTWSNFTLRAGKIAKTVTGSGHPETWCDGPYAIIGSRNDGSSKALDVKYDSILNHCYRDDGTVQVGSGNEATCTGCTDGCIVEFDENLKETDCSGCDDKGGCSLGVGVLT